MKQLALFLLLLWPALAGAQVVKLPPEISVAPNRLIAVTIEWDGDDLRWAVPPELDVFREYDPDPRKVRLRVIGYEDGVYRITAVACKVSDDGKTSKLSEFAACVVTVGKPGPLPPMPPVPPKPPVPPPPPPVPPMPPADPLAGLAAIYAAETDPAKAEIRDKLVTLYRTAVGLANNPAIATWGNLLDAVGTEATVQGVRGKLTATQAALGVYFRAKLPAAQARNAPLDAGGRATAALAFESAASALEGLR